MGRGCTMSEWEHFEKLPNEGRVPNSSYWYVQCRHCVRGFEQKRLFNAPAKLTGRRSAMQAHLKNCPIYSTEYKAQQKKLEMAAAAAEATAAAVESAASNGDATAVSTPAAAVTSDAVATSATMATAKGEKRKRKSDGSSGSRGGRGKHCMIMEEWKHFVRLQDDGYIGNSNFFRAICRHCQRAYDEASEEQKPLMVPERMVGRREKMRKHLSLCPHFQGELPPLERRPSARGGLSPSAVFSALAATAGIPSVSAVAGSGVPAAAATAIGATSGSSTASAATTPNPTAASTGSSRLALDEWNYFTRLHRKKDSAYYYARCNFCQQAFENAPEAMKPSMEPAIVMGRKGNMQTHLAKCPHVPKDALALAKAYSAAFPGAGYNLNLTGLVTASGSVAGSSSTTGSGVPLDLSTLPSAAKRVKFEPPPGTTATPDASSVHRALLEFLMEHRLAFEWVESTSAKKLFCALMGTPDEASLVPNAVELRTRVLDEMLDETTQSELAKLQERIPLGLGATAFSGQADMLTDASMPAWPVTLQCTLRMPKSSAGVPEIEGAVTDGKTLAPLGFVAKQSLDTDVGEHGDKLAVYHGLEVARWLDQQLHHCVDSSKLTLATVVLPYSFAMHRAVGILRAPTRWPHVAFITNVEDLLAFPLTKMLATTELYAAVSSLVELWQVETVRNCVANKLAMETKAEASRRPFQDWKTCMALIKVLLDDKTFANAEDKSGAIHAKKLVESTLDRSLLERVYALLRAFATAVKSCQMGLTLSESLVQLGALFKAADGFPAVQLALEVVWAQLEQPLFVLAHALNPRVRLRDLDSTELTKLSVLSDLSVSYFSSLFGRKPSSLRGEVTAYLHTSQQVFTPSFVSEFPIVDDYFRYLSDDYPSLSMLMRVLHSFSSVEIANRSTETATSDHDNSMYTSEEACKLEYLRERWGIAKADAAKSSTCVTANHTSDGVEALNPGPVVNEWKEALEISLQARAVEFTLLDTHFDAAEESGLVMVATDGGNASSDMPAVSDAQMPLPSLAMDNETLYPSMPLRMPFAKKVSLKELFKAAEATI